MRAIRGLVIGFVVGVIILAVMLLGLKQASGEAMRYILVAMLGGVATGLVGVRTHVARGEFAAALIKLVLASVIGGAFSWAPVRYFGLPQNLVELFGAQLAGPYSFAGILVGTSMCGLLFELDNPPAKLDG